MPLQANKRARVPLISAHRMATANRPSPSASTHPTAPQAAAPKADDSKPTVDKPKVPDHVDTPAGPLGIPDVSKVLPGADTPKVPPPPPVGTGQTDNRGDTQLLDYLLK